MNGQIGTSEEVGEESAEITGQIIMGGCFACW